MAEKKFDGVVEAVHYQPNGQVDWVRVYLRRGPTWSDRVIMRRQELINEIKSGKRMMVGQRVEFMAGTFDVTMPVKVSGSNGQEVLVTSSNQSDRDNLEGVPAL